jgi:hypothetical protein
MNGINPFSARLQPAWRPGQPASLRLAAPGAASAAVSFAAAVRGRYGARGTTAQTPELVLARTAPPAWQPVFRQTLVRVEPRLTLAVRPTVRVESVERQVEQRLAWQPGAPAGEAAPPTQMVSQLLMRSTRFEAGELAATGVAAASVGQASAADARRTRPPATRGPELIVHRTTVVLPAASQAHTSPAAVAVRPDNALTADRWSAPPPAAAGWQTRAPEVTLDVQRLTDQVMDVLDRRLLAARERMGRG